ncbi:MAG TPA: hypothetical protein VI893_10500 [Thermoplasmata archaeon]|nr:hypothetical protein [Thermoplasmata archaeon]
MATKPRPQRKIPDLPPPTADEPFEGLSELMLEGAAFIARDSDPVPVKDRLPPIEVFKRIVAAFQARGIPFLVEGGWAVAAYGLERMTRDIDLIIPISTDQATEAFEAIIGLGGTCILPEGADERVAADIETWLMAFRLGGWRVDLLKETQYVALAKRSIPMELSGCKVRLIDPMDLVKRKLLRNSPKDKVDVDFLLRNYGPDAKGG